MTDDGPRQASAHDRVQADVGLSYDLCSVCRFSSRLLRLEYAPPDHRSDHPDGRRRDHRPRRAIPPGRLRRLVFVVDARSRRPGSSLYLVTTRAGEGLAGNVGSLATGVLETSGWTETVYRRHDDPEGVEHPALVRVFQFRADSGFWSDATSRSGTACARSCSRPVAGRWRSSSCSGWPEVCS